MRLATFAFLGVLLAAAACLLCMSPHTYALQDRGNIGATLSKTYLAGTDELGRDRAVRLSAALLLGFAGAGAAALLASGLAVLLGGTAAICPPRVSRLLLYGGDLFLTLPWIFLLMLIRSALPLNLPSWKAAGLTFLLLGGLGAPAFLRVNYQRISALLQSGWLVQAHANGLTPRQIARQVLPHLGPIFWVQFLLYVPACIVAEANLGTLGLGISEPLPSWGNMLNGLQSAALLGNSHLVYLPLAVLVFVLVALELAIFGARHEP